jgi:hypothetical protein
MANIRLFEHSNIAGRQLFISSPKAQRYVLATSQFLDEFEFNNITSSVRLSANTKEPCHSCILFENDRFEGQFKAFAFNDVRNIISLPYFNDLTSSVILVSQEPGEKVTLTCLREWAGDRINLAVDHELNSFPEITRNGNILIKFSIDAYEIGQFGNDLVKIDIPLDIRSPFPFGHYQVKLVYYVDLFITEPNILKAGVVGGSYWIMQGLLSRNIESRLHYYSRKIALLIESEINQLLHEFSWHPWKDIYLLPGLVKDTEKDFEGDVEDDCTVVLVPLD